MKNALSFPTLALAVCSAGVLASSAFGADTVFKNHLKSHAMVSPAQLYQVNQTKSDFQLGFTNANFDSGTSSNEVSGTDLFAAAIFSAEVMDLRAGASLEYTKGTAETKTDGAATTELDITEMSLTPQASILAGPVSIGAAWQATQAKVEVDAAGSTEETLSYSRPIFGATLVQPDVEAGLVYKAKVDEEENNIAVETPSEITAHGRMAIDSTMAVGGTLTQVNQTDFEEDGAEFDDQHKIRAIFESATGPAKIEADLGYNTEWYDNKDTAKASQIATWEIAASADYNFSPTANLGAAAGYEFGNDSNATEDLTVSNTSFAVRGNMRF